MNSCDYLSLTQTKDACFYVLQNCVDTATFNFTKFYFCQIDASQTTLFILAPIFLFIIFQFLIGTTNQYLSPAVAHLAEQLKMSQTLSGITLIAFANGAPDVLTALIASTDEQGILISVGSIFGSGLIMTTLVVGSVIYSAKLIRANQTALIRDLLFNITGVSLIIIFSFIGYINEVFAILFLILYFIYMIVVILNEQHEKQKSQHNQEQLIQKSFMIEECEALLNNDYSISAMNEIDEDTQNEILSQMDNYKTLHSEDQQQQKQQKQQQNTLDKIHSFFNKPLDFIQLITIPNPEPIKYHFNLISFLLVPTTILLLLGYDNKTLILEVPAWHYTLLFGALLLIIQLAIGFPKVLISLITIVSSIIWCKYLIEIVINFLLFIQLISGLSYPYLGMTFLAFGNSSCDLFVNTKLASIGYGLMAISGSYAGAFFNMNAGFGAALFKLTWIEKKIIKFDLFAQFQQEFGEQNQQIAFILLMFSLVNLVLTLILVIISRFQLKQKISIYFFIYYACFIISITLATIYL